MIALCAGFGFDREERRSRADRAPCVDFKSRTARGHNENRVQVDELFMAHHFKSKTPGQRTCPTRQSAGVL